jgi:hypothetical protein
MRETQPNYRHESVVALNCSAPLATVAHAESMTACTGIVLTGMYSIYQLHLHSTKRYTLFMALTCTFFLYMFS